MRQKAVTLLVLVAQLATLCVVVSSCSAPRRKSSSSPLDGADEGLGPKALPQQKVSLLNLDAAGREAAWLEATLRALSLRLGEGAVPAKIRFVEKRFETPFSEVQPVYVGAQGDWYFHVGALRGLRFENELAAAVSAARALALLSADQEGSWRTVARMMVGELYRVGYDPRGVGIFWKNWGRLMADDPRGHDWATLAFELDDESQKEIAKLPPLMNPVVRTPDFAKIGKRLQKL